MSIPIDAFTRLTGYSVEDIGPNRALSTRATRSHRPVSP